jgi:hypothetical protein
VRRVSPRAAFSVAVTDASASVALCFGTILSTKIYSFHALFFYGKMDVSSGEPGIGRAERLKEIVPPKLYTTADLLHVTAEQP